MQGIDNYVPEANHVSRVYGVATSLVTIFGIAESEREGTRRNQNWSFCEMDESI